MRTWTALQVVAYLERKRAYLDDHYAAGVIAEMLNKQLEPEAKPDPLIEGLPVIWAPGWVERICS
jgi:phosphosulfolactate phosphohydrolase-like enzyme